MFLLAWTGPEALVDADELDCGRRRSVHCTASTMNGPPAAGLGPRRREDQRPVGPLLRARRRRHGGDADLGGMRVEQVLAVAGRRLPAGHRLVEAPIAGAEIFRRSAPIVTRGRKPLRQRAADAVAHPVALRPWPAPCRRPPASGASSPSTGPRPFCGAIGGDEARRAAGIDGDRRGGLKRAGRAGCEPEPGGQGGEGPAASRIAFREVARPLP